MEFLSPDFIENVATLLFTTSLKAFVEIYGDCSPIKRVTLDLCYYQDKQLYYRIRLLPYDAVLSVAYLKEHWNTWLWAFDSIIVHPKMFQNPSSLTSEDRNYLKEIISRNSRRITEVKFKGIRILHPNSVAHTLSLVGVERIPPKSHVYGLLQACPAVESLQLLRNDFDLPASFFRDIKSWAEQGVRAFGLRGEYKFNNPLQGLLEMLIRNKLIEEVAIDSGHVDPHVLVRWAIQNVNGNKRYRISLPEYPQRWKVWSTLTLADEEVTSDGRKLYFLQPESILEVSFSKVSDWLFKLSVL